MACKVCSRSENHCRKAEASSELRWMCVWLSIMHMPPSLRSSHGFMFSLSFCAAVSLLLERRNKQSTRLWWLRELFLEDTTSGRVTAGESPRPFRAPSQQEGSPPRQKHTISVDGFLTKTDHRFLSF